MVFSPSKIIESADFLGIAFTFKVNGKKHYKSTVGGVLSIICLLVSIVLIVLFGKDFFYKTNPRMTIQQKVPEKAIPLKVSENFTFLWRVEDTNSIKMNLDEIPFYPYLAYRRYSKDSQGLWTNQLIYEMNIISCDNLKNSKAIREIIPAQFNLSEWYCLDWDFINQQLAPLNETMEVGGFWDDQFAYNIEIGAFSCQYDWKESAINTSSCHSFNDLLVLNQKQYYMSFVYSNYYIDPSNYTQALNSMYTNKYFLLNPNLVHTERFMFEVIQLLDDNGWIFESSKLFSTVNMDHTESDFGFLSQDKVSGNFFLFDLYIYFMKRNTTYYRSYMKIQDLAAVIGGFMKFILTLFSLINLIISKLEGDKFIVSEIFDLNSLRTNANSIELSTAKINASSKNQNINLTNPLYNSFMPQLKTKEKKDSDLGFVMKSIDHDKSKEVGPIFPSFYKYMTTTFCFCRFCSNKTLSNRTFNQAKDIIYEKLDILYYLSSLNCVNQLFSTLVPKNDLALLQHVRKAKLSEEIEYFHRGKEEEINSSKLINYLRKLSKEEAERKLLILNERIVDSYYRVKA